MRRTRWTTVLACFATTTVLSLVALDLILRSRGWIPALTAWGAATGLVIAMVILVAGLAVRRLRARQATWITPTGAAATAAGAQASALAGSCIGGVYAGGLACALLAPASPAISDLALTSGLCLAACAVWCGVGLLVEHWCAIDSSDDDDDHSTGPARSGGAATPGAAA
ncbi:MULTISPECIES: DUF3180 family protein [Actinomyces]|uniref:DUF3180 family protein n=1 Tax=Actinomyces TaxID=1654 RepID=UPI00135CA70D|nr:MULTISPECIES: DUF3180 family protein [Actinomyces]